ncbi:amino acid permease [Streptomyces sp. NPDC002078]
MGWFDVPTAFGRPATVAACCHCCRYSLLTVVPAQKVTGIGGFMEGAPLVFGVYGGTAGPLRTLTAVMFVFALLTHGSAWMIVSDRMQAMAAAQGAFFTSALGALHPRLGTPVRTNLLSGAVATVFMPAAMRLARGDAGAVFAVVLPVAVTTLLLSCLVVVPALMVLRLRHPDVPRPLSQRPGRDLRHRLRLPRRLGRLPRLVRGLRPRHRRLAAPRRRRGHDRRPPRTPEVSGGGPTLNACSEKESLAPGNDSPSVRMPAWFPRLGPPWRGR